MRQILLSLIFVTLVVQPAFSQNVPEIKSKEQAIEILKNSEFVDLFRYPDQTDQNIERFIREINKFTTVDMELKDELSNLAQDCDIVFWPWGGTPFFEEPFREVLERRLGKSKLERLSANLEISFAAYDYLTLVQMRENDGIVRGSIWLPEYIETVYNYFGI